MIKLLRKAKDGVTYREVWYSDSTVYVHSGTVGKRGTLEKHRALFDQANSIIAAFSKQAFREGYEDATDATSDLTLMLPVEGFGTAEQLQARHTIEDLLDQALGWTGNGRCTGGDAGSNTMQIYCEVVVPEAAIPVIKDCVQVFPPLFTSAEITYADQRITLKPTES